jgi:hypothetical protein
VPSFFSLAKIVFSLLISRRLACRNAQGDMHSASIDTDWHYVASVAN